MEGKSNLWDEKTYIIYIHSDGLLYKIKVKGTGTPTSIKYFYGQSDALINNSACHPYFAETADQIRLHDYQSCLRNQMEVMTYRHDLYTAAMPKALIDTDSACNDDCRNAKSYYLNAVKLGVPDIYKVFDPYYTNEFGFTDENRAEIRTVWEEYSRKMDEEE